MTTRVIFFSSHDFSELTDLLLDTDFLYVKFQVILNSCCRILHELSFSMNVSRTSFKKVYFNMATAERFFSSHEFSEVTDTA